MNEHYLIEWTRAEVTFKVLSVHRTRQDALKQRSAQWSNMGALSPNGPIFVLSSKALTVVGPAGVGCIRHGQRLQVGNRYPKFIAPADIGLRS